MEIRRMRCGDYEEAYQLWLACSGMGLNDLDDSPGGIARFLQRNPDTCFVAVAAGRIVGAILAGSDGRRGYIYHTAVHPGCRNMGIATRLVAQALEALEQMGVHKAALVVFERNESGNKFWEKLGFRVREDLVYRNRPLAETSKINT